MFDAINLNERKQIPQMLCGNYQITCEKKHKQKKEKCFPDISNTVALIVSTTTKRFPSLISASEKNFIAWEDECYSIIQKAMKM